MMSLQLRRYRNYRFDLLAIALLIGLWFLGNWRALTPITADQWSVSGGDFSAHSLVYSSYAASRLSTGEIPLWWPYNYGGQPFFADPESAAAYPIRLLMIAASRGQWSYGTLQAEALLHLLAASLSMYGCARVLGAGYIGAFVAALVFAHGGFLNGYPLQQLHILETITWLPLVIGLIHLSVTRASHAGIVLAGGALGIAFLAGHTQTALYMAYAAVAYLLYVARVQRATSWRAIAGQVALLGVVTFLISAVTLIPAAEYLPRTTRDADFDFAAKSSGLNFGALLQAIYPGVVSLFSPLYVGIAALFLAAAGLKHRFWAGAALISGLFAFGGNSILFSALYWTLPGVSLFRNPERALGITILALALLSGLGLRAILDGAISRPAWRWLFGASAALTATAGLIAAVVTLALLVSASGNPAARLDQIWLALIVSVGTFGLLWLARSQPRRLAVGIAFAALVAWELLSWASGSPVAYQPVPAAEQLPRPTYLDRLTPGEWRIDGARALTPYASLYGLGDVYGVSPLRLTSVARLLELPVDRFWELLAVRYVVSEHDSLPTASRVTAEGDDANGHYYVHEIEEPRPYAWLVYKADVNPDPAFARQIIADRRFDPRDTVIVPREPPLPLSGTRPLGASARIEQFSPELISVSVDTPENAALTLALPAYPGWQATVDDSPTIIETAYTALSAVYVPAGQHIIELRFAPTVVLLGAALSAVGWGWVIVALIRLLQRRLRR